jgi:hypothetical protein
MHQYHQLGLLEGLSATAWLKSLWVQQEYWNPGLAALPDSSSFHNTFSAYLGVFTHLDTLEALGVQGIDTGPARPPLCRTASLAAARKHPSRKP